LVRSATDIFSRPPYYSELVTARCLKDRVAGTSSTRCPVRGRLRTEILKTKFPQTATVTYILGCVCVCMCVYGCVCVCVYMCVCVCIYVCMYTYVCVYVCMYVCIYIYMHLSTYVCMYVCTYAAYVCMYICKNVCRLVGCSVTPVAPYI